LHNDLKAEKNYSTYYIIYLHAPTCLLVLAFMI